jgi:hypothetical protein
MAGCRSMRRRRVSDAVTSTEIADDGLHDACITAALDAAFTYAGTHKHTHTRTNTQVHKDTMKTHTQTGARRHAHANTPNTRMHTRQENPAMTPPASPIPSSRRTSCSPSLHTPSHTHKHWQTPTRPTHIAHVDEGLHRRIDEKNARTRKHANTAREPGDDTARFPHTLFTQHLLALPAHALPYTPTHTRLAAPHAPNTHCTR